MAVDAVEATESLPKEAGLVGLDGPLDELDSVSYTHLTLPTICSV